LIAHDQAARFCDEVTIVSGSGRNALIICASVLAIAVLYFARSVFAPVAVSLFAVAVVWPVQKWLEARLPQLIALAITLLLTVFVLSALLALSVWGIGHVGRWMIVNAAHLQAFYVQLTQWLESHGIFVVGIFLEKFDVAWLVRPAQELASNVRTLVAFAILVLVFMMLALLEVRDFKAKLQTACPEKFASRMLRASKLIAEKFRRYAVIRTIASILTGLMVGLLCWALGVELATAWGVLAFVLNFIPFIGPFVATVLPALFAIVQFQSWEAATIIFAGVSLIQFLIGSYLEPRLSGSALSISPFLVVFSVFFAALLWGIPGAFMGVPLAIAVLTILEQYPSTSWISELLSGTPPHSGRARSRD
jgi:AI-2 transport protein TqsA